MACVEAAFWIISVIGLFCLFDTLEKGLNPVEKLFESYQAERNLLIQAIKVP